MSRTRLIVMLLAALVLLSMARGIIVSMFVEGGLLDERQAQGRHQNVAACQALQECPPARRSVLLN